MCQIYITKLRESLFRNTEHFFWNLKEIKNNLCPFSAKDHEKRDSEEIYWILNEKGKKCIRIPMTYNPSCAFDQNLLESPPHFYTCPCAFLSLCTSIDFCNDFPLYVYYRRERNASFSCIGNAGSSLFPLVQIVRWMRGRLRKLCC